MSPHPGAERSPPTDLPPRPPSSSPVRAGTARASGVRCTPRSRSSRRPSTPCARRSPSHWRTPRRGGPVVPVTCCRWPGWGSPSPARPRPPWSTARSTRSLPCSRSRWPSSACWRTGAYAPTCWPGTASATSPPPTAPARSTCPTRVPWSRPARRPVRPTPWPRSPSRPAPTRPPRAWSSTGWQRPSPSPPWPAPSRSCCPARQRPYDGWRRRGRISAGPSSTCRTTGTRPPAGSPRTARGRQS